MNKKLEIENKNIKFLLIFGTNTFCSTKKIVLFPNTYRTLLKMPEVYNSNNNDTPRSYINSAFEHVFENDPGESEKLGSMKNDDGNRSDERDAIVNDRDCTGNIFDNKSWAGFDGKAMEETPMRRMSVFEPSQLNMKEAVGVWVVDFFLEIFYK